MGDSRLPRRARLSGQGAFDAVFQRGQRRHGTLFRLHAVPADAGTAALGIAVPKRGAALAIERNRIRRVVREVYRARRIALARWQVVVLARASATNASGAALRADLERLFDTLLALKLPPGDGTIAR